MKWLPYALLALGLGTAAGAVFGVWWSNQSGERICRRLERDCGEFAMPMDECLQGRQHDLLTYGVRAVREVDACLSRAPSDCLSATACIVSVEGR